jgi:hypothetical protein
MQLLLHDADDVIHVERRVVIVPAQHAEFGKAGGGLLDKMRERDGAVGVFAVGGNEQKIVRLPRLTVSLVGGLAFFENEGAENLPHDDYGQMFFLEIDEENSPRLVASKRAELFDLLDDVGIAGAPVIVKALFVAFGIGSSTVDVGSFQ